LNPSTRQGYAKEEPMGRQIDPRGMGLKIAFFRKKQRLTQAALADRIGISTRYMSKIECGDLSHSVSLPILDRIAEELDTGIEDLMAYK